MTNFYNNLTEIKNLFSRWFNEFEIIECELGADKGDGYFSIMRKVDIKLNNEKIVHLMLKCAPSDEKFREMVPVQLAYRREIYFYQTIWPCFVKYQQRFNSSPFDSITQCYGNVEHVGKEVLVLENLKAYGFSLWERSKPMTEDHLRLVLKEYGKFHAISYAMKENDKELYSSLTNGMTKVYSELSTELSFIETFRQGILQVQELYADNNLNIYTRLDNLQNNITQFYQKLEGERQFSVITHGDCWCTNYLFKYENNQPNYVRFIDFQLTRVASPVLDLSYFIYVHATKEVLENLKIYVEIYHEALTEHYLNLGGNAENLISLDELKQEWMIYGRFGLILACTILRVCYTDKEECVDLIDAAESGIKVEEVYVRKRKYDFIVNERLKCLVLHLCDNNYL